VGQVRASLAKLDGTIVSIVGRASRWREMRRKNWICLDYFVVNEQDNVFFEEDHVHIEMTDHDRITFREGDWVQVRGRVYSYEKKITSDRFRNYSVKREIADRLWRPSEQQTGEFAYCYANQIDLVRVLRGESVLELNEHFTTNEYFDPLFEELTEMPEGTSRYVGPGEDLWFYRVTVDGPFVDWHTFKRNRRKSALFPTARHIKGYYNFITAAGSRPREWRFSQTPVGKERWLAIQPIPPSKGHSRDGRALFKCRPLVET
jgi:hypothetical protein